jgi:2-polyprenyl-6-hydroxyphenyl methylase / 3-demethylubiquinone-9 3-methyltransferase
MNNHRRKGYNRIDNQIYNSEEAGWWNTDSPLHLIKLLLNPVRIGFIQRKLSEQFKHDLIGKKALEVGCGGGILCEELAGLGLEVTGIDPSEQSIHCAIKHAEKSGLYLNYQVSEGEYMPFNEKCFDIVFCCDVLEHVRNLTQVISEISRVLKPGGMVIYDTINRTLISNLVAIRILQKWSYWALLPANLHVWEMFIKPEELRNLFLQYKMEIKENIGIVPDVAVLKILSFLHQRASGKLSIKNFGSKFHLSEGRSLNVSYMGYAIKRDN